LRENIHLGAVVYMGSGSDLSFAGHPILAI